MTPLGEYCYIINTMVESTTYLNTYVVLAVSLSLFLINSILQRLLASRRKSLSPSEKDAFTHIEQRDYPGFLQTMTTHAIDPNLQNTTRLSLLMMSIYKRSHSQDSHQILEYLLSQKGIRVD